MNAAGKPAGVSIPVKAQDGSSLGFSIEVDPSKIGDGMPRTVAAATLGWKPRIVLDGEVLPFSTENAAALYQRIPSILRQIVEATTKEQ